MNSLLSEIVAHVRLTNPNASAEEISEGIADIIGKEVLPEVMKNMSLPHFPSFRSIELDESKRTKGRRKTKNAQLIGLRHRRSLIQQIERVRSDMGWDGIDDLTLKLFISNSTSPYYIPKTDLPLPRGDIMKKTDLNEESQITDKEPVNATYQKMPIPLERNAIRMSETAERKIVSEPIFEEVFKNIELQLRNIMISRNLLTEIDVVCKSDIEIPSWNKCVLKVHPPIELDFKERMNISTIFDITIRDIIKGLKKTADPPTIEYLQNLNRNLFVHIDL